MKKVLIVLVLSIAVCPCLLAQSGDGLRVFISVDMEGLTGVANGEEVSRSGKDYGHFRNII